MKDYNEWDIQTQLEAENALHLRLDKEKEEQSLTLRRILTNKILENLKYFANLDEYGNVVITNEEFMIVSKSIAADIGKMIERGAFK